jgi:hypothetical protein
MKKMAIATHPFIQADETSSNNHLIVQFESAMSELLSSAQHCSSRRRESSMIGSTQLPTCCRYRQQATLCPRLSEA